MSSTIGIIVPANLKYAPYIDNYINILKKEGTDFRIMSWDKAGIDEKEADFVFHQKTSDADRMKILLGYVRFVAACKKYIRKEKIDRLIILTIAPAFFLSPLFMRSFAKRYLLDIRDESPFVKRFPGMFKRLCNDASKVIVSSRLFNEWIPHETQLCHNVDVSLICPTAAAYAKAEEGSPIRIVFAGMMIEGQINIDVLRQFVGNKDYEFKFIGRESSGSCAIAEFAKTNQMDNVSFAGTYQKAEIAGIYQEQADLVNILRKKSTVNRNALPNKMYDAVLAGVPILVFEHNKAIAEYVKEYSLGVVLSEEDMNDLPKAIAEKYKAFDTIAYHAGRERFLAQVRQDMEAFSTTVRQFVR